MKKEKIQMSIRVDARNIEDLKKMAEVEDRSLNNMINVALSYFLKNGAEKYQELKSEIRESIFKA